MSEEIIITGKWSLQELDALLRGACMIAGTGRRIAFLSSHFVGIPYKENTLIGDIETPEVFVVDLESVDCFTFLEYIEAMRLAGSFSEFKGKLKRIRYQDAKVDYRKRNHFFTDWIEYNSVFAEDITTQAGCNKTAFIKKTLNIKEDGTYFLPGIAPRTRMIKYIPSEAIDAGMIEKLKTGDYIGIFSEKEGLDVSHVGIFINNKGEAVLRHASSEKTLRKVVDQGFMDYIKNKPGIVVLRHR